MYVSFCLTSGAVNLKVLRLDLKDLSQINWLYARTSLVYKALCRNLKTPHSGIITSKYEAGIVSESNSLSFKFYLMLQHWKLKQICFSWMIRISLYNCCFVNVLTISAVWSRSRTNCIINLVNSQYKYPFIITIYPFKHCK